MAHPQKSDASSAHNAKLHRMTRHYGSASGPDKNRLAAVENLKDEGPEDHVGFGADYAAATSRSDKPARKAVAANPIATYKKGGCVEPIEVATRARGGRLHSKGKKGSTHVNVIVAPQGQGQAGMPPAPPPALAAMAAPKPPMPPAGGPPMGAPPMGGPGGPPPMMGRKRGGKVHEDEAQDKNLIHKVLKSEGLERERAKGGSVIGDEGKVPNLSSMDSGSMSGPGRLEKIAIQKKNKPKAQAV